MEGPTSFPTNVDYNSVKLIYAVNIVYLKKKSPVKKKRAIANTTHWDV